MDRRKLYFLALMLIIWTGFISLRITQCQSNQKNPPIAQAGKQENYPTTQSSKGINESAQSGSNLRTAIADVARRNIPAVVHIDVLQQQEVSNPMLPFDNDPFFRFFFNGPKMPRKFKKEMRGLGTGMIIDDKGNILTNNHVVAGATKINVLLADDSSYPAKLVGTDPKTDLAVIQIESKEKLPSVAFGDSDTMMVGDWVVAIGHPRGLDQTVTQGIISAKHRRGVLDPNTYQDYLQTDAAINPGNSGGPLLNLNGEVVGVNAAIESQSGGFEGIGFAIPSNMAVHVAKALIENGKVVRGWLGVGISDVTPEQARSMKLKSKKGALITEVFPEGPADQAGIQKEDLVVEYQGQKIDDSASLQNLVGNTPVGETAQLKISRKGKPIELTVKVNDQQEALRKIAASVEDRLGVVVRPLTEQESRQYGLPSGRGVAVASLKTGGLLIRAGFEKDDVILDINNIPVEGLEGFITLIKALPSHHQALIKALDHRSGDSGYVKVMMG